METLIEEASNNNLFNFFVIFVNDEANGNFWPTYVEIWDNHPKLVRPRQACVKNNGPFELKKCTVMLFLSLRFFPDRFCCWNKQRLVIFVKDILSINKIIT